MTDEADDTGINAAELLLAALDASEESVESPFHCVAVITLVIYSGPGGDLRMATNASHSTRPILCSTRTMNALGKLTRNVRESIDRELETFGEAAGLLRAELGKKFDG